MRRMEVDPSDLAAANAHISELEREVERLKKEAQLHGYYKCVPKKDAEDKMEELLNENAALRSQLSTAREGLEFYANQEHYLGTEAWDTVSGESEAWLFDVSDDDNSSAGVENGATARITLAALDATSHKTAPSDTVSDTSVVKRGPQSGCWVCAHSPRCQGVLGIPRHTDCDFEPSRFTPVRKEV